MKKIKILSIGTTLLVLGIAPLFAQSTVSTPIVGFTTLDVRGKSGANNALSYISLNLSRPKSFSGTIGTKSLNGSGQTVITFGSNLFTPNQFNASTNRHFFQVKSGANNGLVTEVVGTTENSITVSDNLDAVLESGTTSFDVTPYWTLGTAFPAAAGLKTGTSATAGDNLTIIDPATGTANSYFYSSTLNQWRKGTTDSTHVIIPPGAGIMVTRKDSSSVGVVISGQVRTGPVQTDIAAAPSTGSRVTYLANPYPLASMTLGQSGLYTGNSTTGIAGGTSATAADNVIIVDPSTGTANSYFYNTSVGKWRKGVTDSDNVAIPDGSALIISRKANRGSFEWYIPQPPF
jgi:uncharacterized protein (TIGR02597 family)